MYIISVVIDSDKIRAAIYSKEYKQLCAAETAYSDVCGENAISDIAELCKNIMREGDIKAQDVKFIGVATPISFGFANSVAAEIERNTGIKTVVESIINARALGEAYISGDIPSLVLLSVEDIVEGGVVIDNKIYSGTHGLDAKLAHMVIKFGGYECKCGRKGCFEAYASRAGLRRTAGEAGVKGAANLTVTDLFAMNDECAEIAKKRYTEDLASGITDVINLFQPNELVLEGSFMKVGDELMKPMMEIILREQYSSSIPNKCVIREPNYDTDTALIGAALLCR